PSCRSVPHWPRRNECYFFGITSVSERHMSRKILALFVIAVFSPTLPAFSQSAPTTPAQASLLDGGGARKLLEFVSKQGSEAQFDPQVTQMLGLTKPGQVLQLKQL